ncbi:hypothetical protein AVEN_180387-1, partial [Araneus ventricosus]
KPDSTKDPPCMWAWWTLDQKQWIKRTPGAVLRKLVERGASSGVVLVI